MEFFHLFPLRLALGIEPVQGRISLTGFAMELLPTIWGVTVFDNVGTLAKGTALGNHPLPRIHSELISFDYTTTDLSSERPAPSGTGGDPFTTKKKYILANIH